VQALSFGEKDVRQLEDVGIEADLAFELGDCASGSGN
jgi:hypothetical protein